MTKSNKNWLRGLVMKGVPKETQLRMIDFFRKTSAPRIVKEMKKKG